MRRSVKIDVDGDHFKIKLTESQHALSVNSYLALAEAFHHEAQREFILGPAFSSLGEALTSAQKIEGLSSLTTRLTALEVHALYSLLMLLPSYFSSEELFVNRIGAFRENSFEVAAALSRAFFDVKVPRD